MAVAAHHMLTNCQAIDPPSHTGGVALLTRLVQQWRFRIKERRAYASFDHRDLRDLGISRWAVERELSKPFWRG